MSELTPEEGEIRDDVVALYKAGTKELPHKASIMASAATSMSATLSDVNAQLGKLGFPGVADDIVTMMSDCFEGTRQSVGTLNDIGDAVVSIADSYVAREEFGSRVFAEMGDHLKVGNTPQPMPAPLPETINSDASGWTGPYRPNIFSYPVADAPTPLTPQGLGPTNGGV